MSTYTPTPDLASTNASPLGWGRFGPLDGFACVAPPSESAEGLLAPLPEADEAAVLPSMLLLADVPALPAEADDELLLLVLALAEERSDLLLLLLLLLAEAEDEAWPPLADSESSPDMRSRSASRVVLLTSA